MAGKSETKTEIEASGDAIIIAEGLHAIAEAIREYTRSMSDEYDEPEKKTTTYLDGTPLE